MNSVWNPLGFRETSLFLVIFNQEASECLGFDDQFDLRVFRDETGISCRGKRTVGSVWAANEAGGRHVAH